MEKNCFSFVRKCHQCQIYGYLIHAQPSELHPISAPWPFIAWGMDVIGPIKPKASNGHRFILVAIDYFTKWVEAVTFKAITKKAVVDFVHSNIICHFGIPETIITDNVANLNSHLMREVCEQFKITHHNSTPYWPKANGIVEASNKNIKKILGKIVQSSRQCKPQIIPVLFCAITMMKTSKTVPQKEAASSSQPAGGGAAAEPHSKEFVPAGCPTVIDFKVEKTSSVPGRCEAVSRSSQGRSMRPPSGDEDMPPESPAPKQGDDKKRKKVSSSPNLASVLHHKSFFRIREEHEAEVLELTEKRDAFKLLS
ncbi:uncharacterized protein [Nicotiana sylvestris]|uniref:uncharacterized protein n=1 Tax=Nicotiana sylvestris TaxID=4096 RepID=UPI00388C9071